MENTNLDKELFKLAFENANIGMCLVDLKGNLFKVNAEMANIFGYTIEELEKMTVNDIAHPDYKDVSVKFIKQATTDRLAHSVFEKHYIHKNGSEIVCIVTSSSVKNELNEPLFFISHVQDITAQKQAAIELEIAKQKAESNHARLVEAQSATKVGSWETDLSTFDVIWSEETYKIFEINSQTFKASHPAFLEFVHPDDRKIVDDAFLHSFKTDDYNSIEHRIITAAGTIKYVEERWRIIRNSLNQPIKAFGTCQDITERKKIEHELLNAKEKAEESDRLKTAFLQNMSHEIRTPLNAISGFAGLLDDDDLSEKKRKSYISIIQNSSDQLVSVISDILTISALETKQEKTNIEKVCVNDIIIDLLAIFKQQAQNQNISIYAKKQLNDKQSEIYTDKTKITQILTNLLTNALKFTHEGFVEFGYSLVQTGHALPAHEIEFYVKDSGIGIKPEYHEKIFERFRQADKSINKLYGGTGLGLSISKAFTELLGGKIRVQSEIEKGSTFYFTIPYNAVNKTEATTLTEQQGYAKTILVAEDEEYNFLFIEEMLMNMNVKLIHTKEGRETVDVFKSNANIDLVLMDIKMPVMNGYEAAKIIKQLQPNMTIIAQSAYALEHEQASFSDVFDDYLTKPIKKDIFKRTVMKHLEKQNNR